MKFGRGPAGKHDKNLHKSRKTSSSLAMAVWTCRPQRACRSQTAESVAEADGHRYRDRRAPDRDQCSRALYIRRTTTDVNPRLHSLSFLHPALLLAFPLFTWSLHAVLPSSISVSFWDDLWSGRLEKYWRDDMATLAWCSCRRSLIGDEQHLSRLGQYKHWVWLQGLHMRGEGVVYLFVQLS